MTTTSMLTSPGRAAVAGKYLTIVLAGESYGIPVLRIREIIRLIKITPVPQTPSWVSGVINLRGRVIAVVDARAKFGLTAGTGDQTCIVVVHVPLGSRALHLGLVVDSVEEVVNVGAADIEPTPEFGVAVDTSYLLGIAKTKNRVSMLLDIDRVLTGDSLTNLANVTHA